ncbi:MAG: hypothetical protein WKF56_06370, partial [Candidatus Limnocylindrales bacterium]
MADHVRLVQLGQRRRRLSERLGRQARQGIPGRMRDLAATSTGAAALEQGRLQARTGDAQRTAPLMLRGGRPSPA